MEEAKRTVAAAPLEIDDEASLSPAQVRAEAARMKALHEDLELIVLDYIELLVRASPDDGQERVIPDTCQQLKAMARELAVPVLVVSQIPRFKEGRTDPRPRLSDLKTAPEALLDQNDG